jgi:hypothetical protein
MKTILLSLIMCILLCVAGCGSEFATGAAIGTGVASGGNAYLNAVKAGLDEREALALAQREEAVKKLESTTDELEKIALQNQIAVLEKQVVDIQAQKQAVDISEQALETNWTDPEAVSGLAGTGIAALLAWYFKRNGDVSNKKYGALKAGVNSFLAASDKQSSEQLYTTIGKEQEKAGIKKT